MRLDQYATVKDSYALCYLGWSREYLIQLCEVRPFVEQKFPGMKISIICRDDVDVLDGKDRVFKASNVQHDQFVHVRKMNYMSDGKHPVEQLLLECGISECEIPTGDAPRTVRCVIVSKGTFPTRPLNTKQIDSLRKTAERERYESVLDEDIGTAGLVMGVESLGLFQAAIDGIETRLVPTGVGTRLYGMMFPNGKILSL